MGKKYYFSVGNTKFFTWTIPTHVVESFMKNDTTVPDKKKHPYQEASENLLLSIDQGE